jgi:hypothetical protein
MICYIGLRRYMDKLACYEISSLSERRPAHGLASRPEDEGGDISRFRPPTNILSTPLTSSCLALSNDV